MEHERFTTPRTTGHPGLEVCVSCRRPFVVPMALLDFVDEGLYLLAMECKNCGVLTLGVEEDAALERLERATAADRIEIATAMELARRGRVRPQDV